MLKNFLHPLSSMTPPFSFLSFFDKFPRERPEEEGGDKIFLSF